jgi:sugar/nucleoside kinase (ribokinase family)
MIGVLGYLCIDLTPNLGTTPFAYIPGNLREVDKIEATPGGTVGNTGGALCKLKVPTRLGALVGEDIFANVLEENLKNISSTNSEIYLKKVPQASSGYAIVLSPLNQDRMFLACRGVNDVISATTFDASFRKNLKILHFGYPSLCKKMAGNNGEELVKLFSQCLQENILTSLDMSLPSKDTFFYDVDWIKYLENVLPYTSLFCPSIEELRFMLKDETSSPEELADKLLTLGCSAVLLKMGKDGMLLKVSNNENKTKIFSLFSNHKWTNSFYYEKPFPCKVLNTTGAGDSAIAGFLTGIYSNYDALNCLKLASRVAAYRIAAAGNLSGIPSLQEIIDKGDWK